jgi:hypothetical protein
MFAPGLPIAPPGRRWAVVHPGPAAFPTTSA